MQVKQDQNKKALVLRDDHAVSETHAEPETGAVNYVEVHENAGRKKELGFTTVKKPAQKMQGKNQSKATVSTPGKKSLLTVNQKDYSSKTKGQARKKA